AQVIIKPGQRADSYWKSEDIVKQLHEKAIPIFNALHSGTNHNAYALDALVCSRMTLHPKVEKKFKFKDGWFIRNYEKTILEERNMWTGQRLDCQRKKDDEKEILNNILLPMIRRFSQKAWRYIEAYASGLGEEDAERAFLNPPYLLVALAINSAKEVSPVPGGHDWFRMLPAIVF
ncbi:9547_t:CDS:2, partial [Gigaspora rosea]